MLDRIDLHIDVPAVPLEALTRALDGESSAVIKARVVKARERQRKRFGNEGLLTNAQMRHRQIQQYCQLTAPARALLTQAIEELHFSARSYDKVLKIARTIADLADSERIQPAHVAEAVQHRSFDRQLWT